MNSDINSFNLKNAMRIQGNMMAFKTSNKLEKLMSKIQQNSDLPNILECTK